MKHYTREMQLFMAQVNKIVAALNNFLKQPGSSEREKLFYLLSFAAEIHTEFLRIHPYANGNGHMGRFLVWCLAGYYKRWPQNWPFDDTPSEPYADLLTQFRNGNRDPLIARMASAFIK